MKTMIYLSVAVAALMLPAHAVGFGKSDDQAKGNYAQVKMPLADMFWGDRYGVLAGPFGHAWSLAAHKEDLTPEEIGKRAQTACAGAAA